MLEYWVSTLFFLEDICGKIIGWSYKGARYK